ncbi:hypothetical protein VPH35_064369 [Triticum aestivum]
MVAREDLVSSCQLARTGVDIPRHKDRAHMQLLGLRKVEEMAQDYFDWVVLLQYLVSSSVVKTIGLTLVGHIWQWRVLLRCYPDEGIARNWWWLDSATVALQRRSLSEGVAFGEPFS